MLRFEQWVRKWINICPLFRRNPNTFWRLMCFNVPCFRLCKMSAVLTLISFFNKKMFYYFNFFQRENAWELASPKKWIPSFVSGPFSSEITSIKKCMRNLDNLLGKMLKKITGQIFSHIFTVKGSFQKKDTKASTEVPCLNYECSTT